MNTRAEHLLAMLGWLKSECVFGQAHFRFWRKLAQFSASTSDVWDRYRYFLGSTALAHLDAARVHLNRIIDRSPRAVSITRLLRYAEAHPEIFERWSRDEVLQAIASWKADLVAIDPQVRNLVKQRNEFFAHLSTEYLAGDYAALFGEFPVTYAEVGSTLEALGRLLNRVSGLLDDSGTMMGFVHEDTDVGVPLELLTAAFRQRRAQKRELLEQIQAGNPPRKIEWPRY